MSDPTKAITATAEATGKLADLAGRVGSFVDRICGDAFSQLGGMASDQVRLWRYKQLLSIQDKVDEIHRARGIEGKTIPVPFKLALPIIESASLEDDENLQGLWANLIANAMDPEYAEIIHPASLEVIKQLSADEALILGAMATHKRCPFLFTVEQRKVNYTASNYYEAVRMEYATFCSGIKLKIPWNSQQYLYNLLRLEILEFTLSEMANPTPASIERPQDAVARIEGLKITPFGVAFIRACINEEIQNTF